MDKEEIIKKYLPIIKKNILTLALAFIGLILFAYGMIGLIGSAKQTNKVVFEPAQVSNNSEKAKTEDLIVDVEGGVVKPGVYHVSLLSHIQEALIAAGGLSYEADREWVSKNINLATKLNDGAKIYIQRLGEAVTSTQTVAEGVINSLININTASIYDLDKLPGIGLATAQKIISGRPYNDIKNLLDKKVVGNKIFEQIKDRIAVY